MQSDINELLHLGLHEDTDLDGDDEESMDEASTYLDIDGSGMCGKVIVCK